MKTNLKHVLKVSSITHQYGFSVKILYNVFYTWDYVFKLKITNPSICSFCQSNTESLSQVLIQYPYVKELWNHINIFIENDYKLT